MYEYTATKISIGVVITAGVAAVLYHTSTQKTIHPNPPTKHGDTGHQVRGVDSISAPGTGSAVKSPVGEKSTNAKKSGSPTKSYGDDDSQWQSFARYVASAKDSIAAAIPSVEVPDIPKVLPQWSIGLPEWITELQKELHMEPGSLADEIWKETRNPEVNPEVSWDAKVRIGADLCEEEKMFLQRRREFTRRALAKYLNVPESEIHEDDVPTIATTGSGGGLRAMVAGAGYYHSLEETGLFDCVTYTAGVSGSCWLQCLYNSSVGKQDFSHIISHLKQRIGIHIAYPPAALNLLERTPTNKYLLRGVVEKLKLGHSPYGLVDVYGLLLASRLLVPSDSQSLQTTDLKLSQQRHIISDGSHPLPIYTAVRHEIPGIGAENEENSDISQAEKQDAIGENEKTDTSWFQWFEITPYEVYSEDMEAGIPTWGLGRRYSKGENVEKAIPELSLPLLFGIFGSAFCATLSHYYAEIRPFVTSVSWLATLDEMVLQRTETLSTVHPFDPATVPNYIKDISPEKLPKTCPESLHHSEDIQLMDAGMSNNLACYPLMRKGRNVDIVIAFDSSADIQTANWIKLTEGYATQRKIVGWPVRMGWPPIEEAQAVRELEEAQAENTEEAEKKLEDAMKANGDAVNGDKNGEDEDQRSPSTPLSDSVANENDQAKEEKNEDKKEVRVLRLLDKEEVSKKEFLKKYPLGSCSIWVGNKAERKTDEEPPPTPNDTSEEDWKLMRPDAGIVVAYLPLIPHPSVPSVDPATSPFLSTWNFEWTPEQIDATVSLAKENFKDGEEKLKRTVRAVWMRKREERLRREKMVKGREKEMREMGWKRGDVFS
ncbi:FabD/lysophospholipase-like protein [Ascodesmis nigricans]|uniref:Lysophospholipase n=1 Tax=Ascodesmis nigricans TaxID=341454 RepID=A0A4V3SJ63_9PEZI|nr:FabD/lysophospholipase-like protein [Ascodesmis nigricans]